MNNDSGQGQNNLKMGPSAKTINFKESCAVSLETEIPEALYTGMKEFIGSNPHIDQYGVMSSALANFLYQNGCSDRAVTEKYLSDLFSVTSVQ